MNRIKCVTLVLHWRMDRENVFIFAHVLLGKTMVLCAIYITELFIMKLQTYFISLIFSIWF